MLVYLYKQTPQDTLERELQEWTNNERRAVTYACKVCGSMTWAYIGSRRRLTQRCKTCFGMVKIEAKVKPELHEFLGDEAWREMWNGLEEHMHKMRILVDSYAVGKARSLGRGLQPTEEVSK